MLRLPGEADEVPPLVTPLPEEEVEHEVLPDEALGEPDEFGRVKKRRRSSRSKDEEFDETFTKKEEVDPKLVKYLIGSVVLVGGILTLALLWPSGDKSKFQESEDEARVVVEEVESEEDKLVAEAERAVVRPMLVEEKLVPIYREFLNAESPEEMARWVSHPEITLPRIRAFYGEDFSSDGFSSVVWGEHPIRVGEAIRVVVQDSSYDSRIIYGVDEDGWKIDWESWVGWSELGWDQIKESRPTESVVIRAELSPLSYYNFEFADDSQWSSYRLESMNGENALYGYVPTAGDLDSRLKLHDGIESRPITLKIRYPDESSADNQVIIEEILAEGWFVSEDAS